MITTKLSVGEWGEIFGDVVVAAAILDRLLHHSQVLTIRGDSFSSTLHRVFPSHRIKDSWMMFLAFSTSLDK